MSMDQNNQTIKCSVESCKHHALGCCKLESIDVAPRCGCHSGDCDESECRSYKTR